MIHAPLGSEKKLYLRSYWEKQNFQRISVFNYYKVVKKNEPIQGHLFKSNVRSHFVVRFLSTDMNDISEMEKHL